MARLSNPVVMKPGANEVYRFRIEGQTLRQARNARRVAADSAPTFKCGAQRQAPASV
jgi:hypothetical protein